VVQDAFPDFKGKVKSVAVVFQDVNHSQALFIVSETRSKEFIEHVFSYVAEWGMPEVMAESDCLGQVLIQVESPRHGTTYL
jgi:hypothetical protein